jgi:hypothetical protein
VDKIRPGSNPGFGTIIRKRDGKSGGLPVFRFFISVVSRDCTSGQSGNEKNEIRGEIMNEGLLLLIVVVGWFVLNRFVLPRFGVRT